MFNATSPIPRSDLSLAFTQFVLDNDYLIGEKALPRTPTNYRTEKVSVQPRENYLSTGDDSHANGAEFVRRQSGFKDFLVDNADHGLEELITHQTRAENADFFNVEMAVTTSLVATIKVNQEVRIADQLQSTSTFTGSSLYTDVSATPWTDSTNTQVLAHITAAIAKVAGNCGLAADTMVISKKTFGALLNNVFLRGLYGVNIPYQEFLNNLALAVGLKEILVGGGIKNTANPGKTFVGASIWNDAYVNIFKKATGDTSMALPGLGRTFFWQGMAENNANVIMYPVFARDGDMYRVRQFTHEAVIDPYFGHLLKVA